MIVGFISKTLSKAVPRNTVPVLIVNGIKNMAFSKSDKHLFSQKKSTGHMEKLIIIVHYAMSIRLSG